MCALQRAISSKFHYGEDGCARNEDSTRQEKRSHRGTRLDGLVKMFPHIRGGHAEGEGTGERGGEEGDFYGVAQVQSAAMVGQAKTDGKAPSKVPNVSATRLRVRVCLLCTCVSPVYVCVSFFSKGCRPPYPGCLCSVPEVHTSKPQIWCARGGVGSSKVLIEGDPPAILRTCMV